MTLRCYWLILDEMVSLRREDFGSRDGFLGNQGRDQPRDVEGHHTQEELPLRDCKLPPSNNRLEPRNMQDYNRPLHPLAEGSQRDGQAQLLSLEDLFVQLTPPEHV